MNATKSRMLMQLLLYDKPSFFVSFYDNQEHVYKP